MAARGLWCFLGGPLVHYLRIQLVASWVGAQLYIRVPYARLQLTSTGILLSISTKYLEEGITVGTETSALVRKDGIRALFQCDRWWTGLGTATRIAACWLVRLLQDDSTHIQDMGVCSKVGNRNDRPVRGFNIPYHGLEYSVRSNCWL